MYMVQHQGTQDWSTITSRCVSAGAEAAVAADHS